MTDDNHSDKQAYFMDLFLAYPAVWDAPNLDKKAQVYASALEDIPIGVIDAALNGYLNRLVESTGPNDTPPSVASIRAAVRAAASMERMRGVPDAPGEQHQPQDTDWPHAAALAGMAHTYMRDKQLSEADTARALFCGASLLASKHLSPGDLRGMADAAISCNQPKAAVE